MKQSRSRKFGWTALSLALWAVALMPSGVLGVQVQAPAPAVEADPPFVNSCDSVMIASVREARERVARALGLHGGEKARPMVVVYEGTFSHEAHLMKPGQVRTLPVWMELRLDERSRVAQMRVRVGPTDRAPTETTVFWNDRVARQAGPDKAFAESEGSERTLERAEAGMWQASSVLRQALDAAGTCRVSEAIVADGRTLTPITFTDSASRVWTMLLDGEGRVGRVERVFAHERLGDVCEWTTFEDWREVDGAIVPNKVPYKVSRFLVQGSTTQRFDVSLVSVAADGDATNARQLPLDRRGDIAEWGVSGIEWVELSPHLWSIEIPSVDCRAVLAEREKDLVLIGPTTGDDTCAALLKEIATRFPTKRVGLVAFGHHHPAASGGLRAIVASGAEIVVPRALEAYVRHMLARSTALGAPAVAGTAEPKLTLFDGDTTLQSLAGEIRLINIAEKSAHTFQYVVFYFPDSGVLFEDDLGYFPTSGATRAGPRLMGLEAELTRRGVTPTRLVQLWPVKDVLREVEWKTVVELVGAERARAKDAAKQEAGK